MLVAVDLVIEMVENGLHRGGELHIEVEEIDRKGHREKREAYKQQLFKDRKSTRLNSSHRSLSRMPSSA